MPTDRKELQQLVKVYYHAEVRNKDMAQALGKSSSFVSHVLKGRRILTDYEVCVWAKMCNVNSETIRRGAAERSAQDTVKRIKAGLRDIKLSLERLEAAVKWVE